MIPPASEIKTASARNCRRMSRLRAPIDLRTPISFVRSVTLTSMMFMIPIPAATSAMVLITNAPIRITPAMEAKALFSESFGVNLKIVRLFRLQSARDPHRADACRSKARL